eukprot:CAMPEP_0184206380 /NCGR_PEP_ID=MMETSP0976-20121227/10561_1 /TAXON_ID=483370 /ORGANISM="non described non described, Strain CCMP2097" /LENGTH=119 /DNA_ID=CAMNT_0026511005 /DNA_START=337 /DNA_END=697 /DNA_ORIENTATION=+
MPVFENGPKTALKRSSRRARNSQDAGSRGLLEAPSREAVVSRGYRLEGLLRGAVSRAPQKALFRGAASSGRFEGPSRVAVLRGCLKGSSKDAVSGGRLKRPSQGAVSRRLLEGLSQSAV